MTDAVTRPVLDQLKATPLFAVTLTLISYQLGITLQRLCRGVSLVNPVLVAILLIGGSLVAALSGIGLVELFGGNREVAMSMAPKAATTPIAIAVAQSLDGIPSLTAVLAITSGIFTGVAVALNGLMTSLLVPLLVHFWPR